MMELVWKFLIVFMAILFIVGVMIGIVNSITNDGAIEIEEASIYCEDCGHRYRLLNVSSWGHATEHISYFYICDNCGDLLKTSKYYKVN